MTVMDSRPNPGGGRPSLVDRIKHLRNAWIASRKFQRWAAQFPLTRGFVRRDGEKLMDLMAGFVHSQVLHAVVSLGILDHLAKESVDIGQLSARTNVPVNRLQRLCHAAAALGLLKLEAHGRVRLARLGAALNGAPGVKQMILHHSVLYRDLANPEAFFRGETRPELAEFWPYVFGQGSNVPPEQARVYSELMADTQSLVAEETLKVVDLRSCRKLLDIGGGTGAFLTAVGEAHPHISLTLFDLEGVAEAAAARFSVHGISDRTEVVPGNFRTDSLPAGADTISLIRVLYDHEDATVERLLRKCFDRLPPGGQLIISEPMSGGAQPDRAGDAYFAIYCMAMGTGTVRSPAEIQHMLAGAGFVETQAPRMHRRFITQTILARKPV